MQETYKKNKLQRSRLAAYVRLTENEYKRILKDTLYTGKNIQTLLKENYFCGAVKRSPFKKEDVKNIYLELRRIGSNVNQIAKSLNGGFREGFTPQLEDIKRHLSKLTSFALGSDGVR